MDLRKPQTVAVLRGSLEMRIARNSFGVFSGAVSSSAIKDRLSVPSRAISSSASIQRCRLPMCRDIDVLNKKSSNLHCSAGD